VGIAGRNILHVPTTDEFIVQELRAQIDHQVSGADALDTKAAALAAATFALFTFTLPHVNIDTCPRTIFAFVVIGLTLAAIGLFASSLRPRKEAFAYGVNAVDLIAERGAERAAFLRAYGEGLRLSR
jgi:hypothetical protein